MSSVLLIYPYFHPRFDRSIFRFPPLGISYVAASLRNAGHDVSLLDCTFLNRAEALDRALQVHADAVGIYSMATMREDSLRFARFLRSSSRLLIAGGPLPTCEPESFLSDFDVVVMGEGERAILELLEAYESDRDPAPVKGIAYRKGDDPEVIFTPPRAFETDLDCIPFPARDLLPNSQYMRYWEKYSRPATTSIMTTRGCPFNCEFCSSAVFGRSYRERSAVNIVDEVEQALTLGYTRIHFADDVFTMKPERVARVCQEINERGLQSRFKWECLARVDSVSRDMVCMMKAAGCDRIFFGIESGNDSILKLMNKKISVEGARQAVLAAHSAGVKAGAFFILCYPGETSETVLNTIRFATSLPLDYLSFTVPYPLPGTSLYERVRHKVKKEWGTGSRLINDHSLIFDTDFSELKMKYAILKGEVEFRMKKRLGKGGTFLVKPFTVLSDALFKVMR